MQNHDRIHVIGGGIIGLLSARELLAAGRSVVLFDRQEVGRESSWAGGGILSPLYPWRYPAAVNRLAAVSRAIYPEFCQRLYQNSGIDPEWVSSGLLVLDANEREAAKNWAESESICVEPVDALSLRSLEPALAGRISQGLWMPQIAQVRNPRLIAALKHDLLRSGGDFRENVAIQGFSGRAGRLQGLVTSAGDVSVKQCLVAAGAWTAGLLHALGVPLPIEPVRGQMLLFRCRPGLVRHILLRDYHYVIPRRDGRLLVGSTLEHVGFDKTTTVEAREELQQAALELVPALADCEIERHWAGLRPGSPAGIPFIGEYPGLKGLVVCAGHYRNGFALGPASARLAVDLLLGREPLLDPGPYRLDRG